jgi:hypothetical protein
VPQLHSGIGRRAAFHAAEMAAVLKNLSKSLPYQQPLALPFAQIKGTHRGALGCFNI